MVEEWPKSTFLLDFARNRLLSHIMSHFPFSTARQSKIGENIQCLSNYSLRTMVKHSKAESLKKQISRSIKNNLMAQAVALHFMGSDSD